MAQSSFRVVVDTQSLSRSSRGQVSGVVYTEISAMPFPERKWSDSVVILLASWLESLASAATVANSHVSLRFMDGPFRIEVERGGDYALIRAIDSRRGDAVVSEARTDFGTIRDAIALAAAQVLRACSDKTWWSPDIDRLVQLSADVSA
jgi:hypothetical protein